MSLPEMMTGAVLTGHGGLEKIAIRDDLPVPEPNSGEVLVKVGACGMNSTAQIDAEKKWGPIMCWTRRKGISQPISGKAYPTLSLTLSPMWLGGVLS